jgi:hypothetical protein
LIVHAVSAAGPIGPGIDPTQGPVVHARVSIRAIDGAGMTVTTDDIGYAKVVVAPGAYIARFADLTRSNGQGDSTSLCGGGAFPAKARVPRDGTAFVSLTCWGDG